MRWTSVLAALVVLAVVAPDASARERVGRVASGSAGLRVLKPFPPRFTIHYKPCPDALPEITSCAYPDKAEVWLAPGADRFERWHELGHLFDAQLLTDADRASFTQLLGFEPGTPWFGDYGAFVERHDLSATLPGEQFADAYAACGIGLKPQGERRGGLLVGEWTTAYGYQPSDRQHRRICAAINLLALRALTGSAASRTTWR